MGGRRAVLTPTQTLPHQGEGLFTSPSQPLQPGERGILCPKHMVLRRRTERLDPQQLLQVLPEDCLFLFLG
jgi:hypothetical protein